jgi:glycosyltransferase involved in cell wall biosynthesis
LKILHLSKFYPPVMGGIESVAFELTEGMNRLGLKADVLCANAGFRTSRERSASGYRIVRAGSWGKLLSTSISPSLVTEAKRLCDEYDVVHVQMPDPMAALALRLARPQGKLVVHWQSDVVNQRRALKLYEPLQEWLLRRADAIIATTPPYAESSPSLQAWKSKVHIIPIGISDGTNPDAARKAQALRQRFNGKKIVFSLGRMTYYKGFDVLIDAARSLPADTIVVVGGGGELLQDYRRRVVSEGLTERIDFVGRIPAEDIPGYFAAASVFCLSSIVRAEAYGVVLLEAMAMGRPIVTTDIPGSGVPWVNQHGVTGLNVPVCNAHELADALCRILENPELSARFGHAGRQRFLNRFTAASMVATTVDLYRSLLADTQ